MDIQTQYWEESLSVVETCYFDSKFLKRCNSENLTAELNAALYELPTRNMLQLSRDGPSTNWTTNGQT